MTTSLREVLDDLAAYLRHRIEEGGGSVEIGQDAAESITPWLARSGCVSKRKSAIDDVGLTASHASVNLADVGLELGNIAAEISACTKCPLHSTRTKSVPGQGLAPCELMFIGEGPGEDEDREGLAFVGAAGQLLTRMIEAMGLTRDRVFIANIVKCRPPHNRIPMPDEIAACLPFLHRQIRAVRPKVIVALGATAAKSLLGVESGITHLRGKWHKWEGIPVMPTFHPSYLLRSPSQKKYAWDDLKEVLRVLGRPVPASRGGQD